MNRSRLKPVRIAILTIFALLALGVWCFIIVGGVLAGSIALWEVAAWVVLIVAAALAEVLMRPQG